MSTRRRQRTSTTASFHVSGHEPCRILRITAGERHLCQARALLNHRIASAPAAHRLAMRKRVPLHRAADGSMQLTKHPV